MLSSWVIDREIFLEEATNLRARFDAERGVSNAKAIRLLKVRLFWMDAGGKFLRSDDCHVC